MRRDTAQCKQRTFELKLVHNTQNYLIKEFTVKATAEVFEKATLDFKKAIDPSLSVSSTIYLYKK